jgi:hypothetical protein
MSDVKSQTLEACAALLENTVLLAGIVAGGEPVEGEGSMASLGTLVRVRELQEQLKATAAARAEATAAAIAAAATEKAENEAQVVKAHAWPLQPAAVVEDWPDDHTPRGIVAQVDLKTVPEGTKLYTESQLALEAPTWLPIVTAPKDGQANILLAVIDENGVVSECDSEGAWDWVADEGVEGGGYYCWWSANGRIESPTHWLPAPSVQPSVDADAPAIDRNLPMQARLRVLMMAARRQDTSSEAGRALLTEAIALLDSYRP